MYIYFTESLMLEMTITKRKMVVTLKIDEQTLV